MIGVVSLRDPGHGPALSCHHVSTGVVLISGLSIMCVLSSDISGGTAVTMSLSTFYWNKNVIYVLIAFCHALLSQHIGSMFAYMWREE